MNQSDCSSSSSIESDNDGNVNYKHWILSTSADVVHLNTSNKHVLNSSTISNDATLTQNKILNNSYKSNDNSSTEKKLKKYIKSIPPLTFVRRFDSLVANDDEASN